MKVVYNSKEIMNHTNDYNGLLNRPMINSTVLEGVKTLSDINAYTKEQVDDLIGNSRSIEIVNALPTNLIENTLYYVGPDANDFYTVYLVDEVRNVLNIGTSQFGEYFAGDGVIIDDDNFISAKIDNTTIIVDSENNLHANLSIDSVPIMIGATSSANGEKGLVPAPAIGDQIKYLKGSAEWASIIDIIYPVNSIYLSDSSAHSPNDIFPGTTWAIMNGWDSQIALGYFPHLWTEASGNTAHLISASLPNIVGWFDIGMNIPYQYSSDPDFINGCFSFSAVYNIKSGVSTASVDAGGWKNSGRVISTFDASNGSVGSDGNYMTQANSPYGKSGTVQPPAIDICCWQRMA